MSQSNASPVLQSSTNGEISVWEIANGNLTPEQLRQRAAPLLADKDLSRSVLSLSPEDQTKFIDRVDQVRRDGWFLFTL